MPTHKQIIRYIQSDHVRMEALRAINALELPDWYIAAGFVRNLIWDHQFDVETALRDVDVIYYCPNNTSPERDLELEQCLDAIWPELPWSVKNQARMHQRNGDRPYLSSLDAMQFWPEKQTCIGARLHKNGTISLEHCFDITLQFNGKINWNPRRDIRVFQDRIQQKGWLDNWPSLSVEPHQQSATADCH